jgi:sterol 3beta-glucosyltransferase
VESIYRDLEYARSLIKKRPPTDDDTDNGVNGDGVASRDPKKQQAAGSGYSSSGSGQGAPSEDWSVISDLEESRLDEPRSSLSAHHGDSKVASDIRHSLAAAVMAVLPESLSSRRSSSPKPPS